jgi:putative FmdB family regulatory protein
VPLYEYRCKSCKHQFEVIQKFSDDPVRICPKCGLEAIVQLLCAPTVQFKGSGWYVTDYARKGSSTEGSAKGNRDSGNGDSKRSNGDSKGAADSGSAPPVPESNPSSSASAESK